MIDDPGITIADAETTIADVDPAGDVNVITDGNGRPVVRETFRYGYPGVARRGTRRMPDASTFRDSTQILIPARAIDGLRDGLEERFTLTIVEADGRCRIIGSPAEIKDASAYLSRNGVSIA